MIRDTLLIVSTSYPISSDGSEAAGAFVADFAAAMAHRMPVRVVGPGLSARVEAGPGVPIWRFAAGARPLSLLSPFAPWHWAAIARTLHSLKRQVLAADADDRVAHTLALWALPSGWAARALQRAKGVPYSVWALGSDIWSLGRLPVVGSILSGVCSDAAGAFADGLQLARDAEAICNRRFAFMASCRRLDGVRSDPIRLQPPFRYLFLGRWHTNKGIDLLFDALDCLDEGAWAAIADVHVAGGGPLQPMVETRCARLQKAGRPVRLSGFLDRRQASEALGAADRLLLPSRIESIPVVFSDAMAYRLPVVSMPVGDLPTLLSDGTGWLADAVTGDAFARALRASLHCGHHEAAIESLAMRFDVDAQARSFAESIRKANQAHG